MAAELGADSRGRIGGVDDDTPVLCRTRRPATLARDCPPPWSNSPSPSDRPALPWIREYPETCGTGRCLSDDTPPPPPPSPPPSPLPPPPPPAIRGKEKGEREWTGMSNEIESNEIKKGQEGSRGKRGGYDKHFARYPGEAMLLSATLKLQPVLLRPGSAHIAHIPVVFS